MGNSHNRASQIGSRKQSTHSDREQALTITSQLSLFGNLSGRSGSGRSVQSSASVTRPWSRVSRRRWNDLTLSNPLDASKTAWPVSNKESIFLPEFRIQTELQQRHFEIIEIVARGAFGEVHKVNRISDGKVFALKFLNKAKIVSEGAVRQVKEEARIQTAVGHHVFIAGAVARWQTKKNLYIVSEYIPGGELLTLLDKYGKLPQKLVKIFLAEIAIVLDFLHNAGVIYRDVKPENLLLDEDLHIQLVDFGLSKWLTFGGRTTTLCGTLRYMAPEVLSREPYGHAVDWWSLGVLACRMLTGKFPEPVVRSKADADAAASGNLEDSGSYTHAATTKPGSLPPNANLSKEARGLLLRLLETDPRARLRSLRQLQQTAFFMGFDFHQVMEKKVSPRSILEELILEGAVADSDDAATANPHESHDHEDFEYHQPIVPPTILK